MNKLYENVKIDLGLKPQTLNNTNVTGEYFDMAGYGGALAILEVGAMAASKVSTIELLQATDAAGTDAKGIPTTGGQTATATIAANTAVNEATVALSAVQALDTLTVNGIVYTAHATGTSEFAFSIAGSDTEDGDELVTRINEGAGLAGDIRTGTIYGTPGVTASNSSGTVTLKSTDPGATAITVAQTGGRITLATVKAQAYVEIDGMSLDHDNGFRYVAVKVTTTANTVVSAALLRGPSRNAITQAVGASASV